MKRYHLIVQEGHPSPWPELKRLMRAKYVPERYHQGLLAKLYNLRQGSKSVEAYHDEFQNIIMKLEYREIEEHVVIRFKVGLNKDISSKMTLHRFATLNDAFEAAHDIELEFKKEKVVKYKTSSFNSWSKNKGGAQTSSGWNKGSDVKKPFDGNTPRYLPRDKGITDPTKITKGIQCHKFRGWDHIMHECPNRLIALLQGGEIYLSEEREKEDGGEEDLKKRMSSKMRNRIFVSKKERPSLLYMCGSCANVASTALVEFLKLPTTKHATPYKLQWLSECGELREYEYVFPNELPRGFPLLWGIEHQIDFVPGSQLPNKPAYRRNPKDTKELQRQVEKLLNKGYVKESMSPCVVPVLLVPKKDGTWRMCVDCRAINKITVKYGHHIPSLDDMIDELNVSCVFSKIDLRSGYHQIRMNPDNEWKTAFKTNTTMHDHIEHLRYVFDVLRKEQLYANLDKCSFYVNAVAFLGFVVSSRGVEVDESIIDAIKNWPIPKSISDIRSLHWVGGLKGKGSEHSKEVPTH
ncbi:uncharacterized protein [Solanum tuberosum]|uniref:uncharacterized protein n=1 Tax=Solanum tuberosum TaxID=4113 RepID=UPI00073A0DA6|nr:PREDICTED: uncharacterized protein LOC107062011 [Solanum tuberosum]